jgi:hypothetical protein
MRPFDGGKGSLLFLRLSDRRLRLACRRRELSNRCRHAFGFAINSSAFEGSPKFHNVEPLAARST